ncbi:peroxidase TAP [Clavulina sp. PMI_390]|nr:peroxidase TAP [Clavulina sp. PMI_390]
MKKPLELFYFFQINNAAGFKTCLKTNVVPLVTSTYQILSPPAQQPLALLNIAFSQSGLTTLGITDNLGDSQFAGGQWADATNLNDDTSTWEDVWKGTNIHGVFLMASDQQTYIDNLKSSIEGYCGSSISLLTSIQAAARPGSEAGHEHFGFLDGISNPAVQGFSTSTLPGQAVVPNGSILTNRIGDTGVRPLTGWTKDGSFLVFRKLQQFVPEFNAYLNANAVQNAAGTLTTQQGADLLGARMVGRWKSGAPVDLASTADDAALGADPQRNNNFDYTHPGSLITSDQSHCPFSAHIRKTRPRADLINADVVNVGIRAGTPYGPEVSSSEASSGKTSTERGLAFVEYQSVIANGFRFQQTAWMDSSTFPFLKNETVGIEPIMGQVGGGASKTFFGADPRDASRSFTMPEFIKPLGGEYFFSPSITALNYTIAE